MHWWPSAGACGQINFAPTESSISSFWLVLLIGGGKLAKPGPSGN